MGDEVAVEEQFIMSWIFIFLITNKSFCWQVKNKGNGNPNMKKCYLSKNSN